MQRNSNESFSLESSIAKQLLDIDKHIGELQNEKKALKSLLLKARQENVLNREVTRKNSVNRILIENKVLEILRISRDRVSNRKLYEKALTVIPSLNKNTFRSYIKRMKDNGQIQSKPGGWILPEA